MNKSIKHNRIAISDKILVLSAYLYMVVPIVIFFVGWLKYYVGIALSAVLLFGLYFFIRKRYKEVQHFYIEPIALLAIIVAIIVWVYLSGVGGYFCQRQDWHYRNALLRDLIDYTWPVIYPETGNGLVYYCTFWMVPALFGKMFGWEAANFCLYLWTCIGIFISMLLICKLLGLSTLKKIGIMICLYVCWSGLNILGEIAMAVWGHGEGSIIGGAFGWPEYISNLQYTPNNALLEWVFNQTIVPWIVVPLFLQDKRIDILAYLGLCMFPFAPFPFVGFFGICVMWALFEAVCLIKESKYKQLLKSVFSIPNIIAILSVFVVFGLLFLCNAAVNGSTGAGGMELYTESEDYSNKQFLCTLMFYVLEFLVYSVLIFKENKKNLIYWVINIILVICPLIKVGTGRDFCMRASIPALFILMIMVIKKICQAQTEVLTTRTAILIAVIAVSSLSLVGDWAMSLRQIKETGSYPIVADDVRSLSLRDAALELNFLIESPETTPFFRYLARDKSERDIERDFNVSERYHKEQEY